MDLWCKIVSESEHIYRTAFSYSSIVYSWPIFDSNLII